MQCRQCGKPNPAGARFCLKCGARLTPACPNCGAELPLDPDTRFCPACGHACPACGTACPERGPALVTPSPEPPETAGTIPERIRRLMPQEYVKRLVQAGGQMAGERRLVTILMSDIKGSSAMARGMDPEEWLEIVDGAFEVLIQPIARYEGTVARLEGDAIMAFFGAPIAHEDDPERACRAGLAIVAGAKAYAQRLERERNIYGFAVRVGIHTGWVVVGEVGSDLRMEYTAIGEAPNLTARLESAAEPGTVLISAETHKHIKPLFEVEPLPPIEAKGWLEPVPVFRVAAPKVTAGQVRGIAGLASPLVGREPECRALLGALQQLQAGSGSIVTIVGEAGIGKSRLLAEIRQKTPRTVRWVEGRCLSYGSSIAYLLFQDILRNLLGVAATDSPVHVRTRLRQWAEGLCPDQVADLLPYLARLLLLPQEERDELLLRALDGEKLREGTFRAVQTVMRCVANPTPLVLVCEDLHWADPTSIELLERLLDLTEQVPLLLVLALRPERGHPAWQLRETAGRLHPDRHTDLTLLPLSANHSETLVANLLGAEGLPLPLRQRILRQAEGNPFYVEEILRSLVDTRAIARDEATNRWQPLRAVEEIAIPDTLHGVLVSRIDRLHEEARRLLRVASVIGRIFAYQVLKPVAQEDRLDIHLLTLQREEMIRERAGLLELEYAFKHELTREAAYRGLLKKVRRSMHRRVAEVLEQLYAERIEGQLPLIAHHWDHAGDAAKAVEYLLRAGKQAGGAYAHREAISHFQRASTLLAQLDGADHQQLLAVEEGLGDARAGLAEHEEALAHYDRGLRLASQTPALPGRSAAICRKIAMLYERKAAYETAFNWLERGLSIVQSASTVERARMRLAGAGIHSRQGHHHQALGWCQMGLDLARQSADPGAMAHSLYLLGTIHGHLGHTAEELSFAQESLALYEEMGNLWGQAQALNNLGIACKEQGDLVAAVGHFQRALQIEERLGNAHGVAKLTLGIGNVHLGQGQLDAAAAAYGKSLEIWQHIDFPLGVALSWLNLGHVCAEREQWQESLDHLLLSQQRFEAIASQHFLPEVQQGLAVAYAGLGRLDEALEAAERAVALADELDMGSERAAGLSVLGQVRLARGELARAEELLHSSLALAEEQGNRRQTADTLYQLGCLYQAQARSGDAEATPRSRNALHRAQALFEDLGAQRGLAKVKAKEDMGMQMEVLNE